MLHNESFTGTAAIAIGPYDVLDNEDEDIDTDTSESLMARKKKILNEWEPKFAGGGDYEPGDYQMPSAPGDGVADRKPKKDKVGKFNTDTSNQGKEWPRDHNETAAMCDVDDDGVEHKSQGGHESSVGEPTDGHQNTVSHNWPDQAKNTGSGVAEPFEGNRWSDGGVLKGSGADEAHFTPGSPGMPSDGTITGTSGPQAGQPKEGKWTPDLFATLMEGDLDIQHLFDSYAADGRQAVCVEDFQTLLRAHGSEIQIDEQIVLQLMQNNRQFLFYEGIDANGPYWVATPLAENKPFKGAAEPFGSKPFEEPDSDDDDDDDDDYGDGERSGRRRRRSDQEKEKKSRSGAKSGKPWESRQRSSEPGLQEGGRRRPFGRMINELQQRPPEAEVDLYRSGVTDDPTITPNLDAADPLGSQGGEEDFGLEGGGGRYDEGPGPFGMHNASMEACPDCGCQCPGGEPECPECGTMMGGFGDEDVLGPDIGINAYGETPEEQDEWIDMGVAAPSVSPAGVPSGRWEDEEMDESRQVHSPQINESIRKFMVSARNIIGRNQGQRRSAIGEALNHSWDYHAGGVNPRQCASKIKNSLQDLMEKFPGFSPLTEAGGDAVKSADGSVIGGGGGGGNKSSFLPETDSDMKDEGESWPRSHRTQKSPEETPIMKGTAKGMDGTGGNAKTVKENVARLSRYVKKCLKEGVKGLSGKHEVRFTCLVQEDNGTVNRTSTRIRLAEALADAEELLQVYPADQVVLESYFGQKGYCLRKYDIPLTTVKTRGPLVAGNKALFRFSKIAEQYADNLVAEGYTCRVGRHNWGKAVQVLTEKKKWMQDVESTGRRTPMTKTKRRRRRRQPITA